MWILDLSMNGDGTLLEDAAATAADWWNCFAPAGIWTGQMKTFFLDSTKTAARRSEGATDAGHIEGIIEDDEDRDADL
jgi:hypothetical protein